MLYVFTRNLAIANRSRVTKPFQYNTRA